MAHQIWYVGHEPMGGPNPSPSSPPPPNKKCPNIYILETVGIPTLNHLYIYQYIFLFPVSRDIKWFALCRSWALGWSWLLWNRMWLNILKMIEIPITKPYIFFSCFFVSWGITWYIHCRIWSLTWTRNIKSSIKSFSYVEFDPWWSPIPPIMTSLHLGDLIKAPIIITSYFYCLWTFVPQLQIKIEFHKYR